MTDHFDDRKRDEDRTDDLSEKRESAAAAAAVDREKMERALEQKGKEAEEAHDRYARMYADFENYRKRMQRDLADFRRYANEQMARELLSVVDHLGLAIKAASEADGSNQALLLGVEQVHRQLLDVLEKFGITPFSPQGERFDPAEHDAVMQETREDQPENTVVRVLQDGYRYHDRILRPARVSVSKKPEMREGAPSSDEEAA